MKKHQQELNKKLILIFFSIILFLPATIYAQIENVWVINDGEKVFRNDLNHPDKNGSAIWDGETIQLKGLYNEVLAFQIIVETDTEGADKIEIAVNNPVNRESGKTIGGNTLKYGPAGTIEIFTQHYLEVEDPTSPNWFYGSSNAAPKQMTGWIPDALIPTDALTGQGGFPVEVGPSQNQGFWVDLSLPRDQEDYPPGVYHGTVQVFQEGSLISEIPLEVTLLPHYLPDENNTNVWLFTSGVSAYYPDMSDQQVDDMLMFEGRRHRMDVAGGFGVNRSSFNAESMEAYKPYLDGSAFTPANGYHGPGQGVGIKTFPIGMYGGNVMGDTRVSVQEQADLWVNWFNENEPDATYFWYIIDEPGEDLYPWIQERADWVKSNPGVGKSLPIFTTTGYKEDLSDAIDIFAAYNGVELADLQAARENNGDYWFYNGNRPRYGSVILEGAAVDFRVNSWVLYKYDIDTHFIWHGTHWRHNSQGPKGRLHQNVFQNPLTFINNSMSFGNGDGIIFYPGQMPYYNQEDRGLNRLIPSIRLKNIRRGQQDAALMALVEKQVGRAKVTEIISKAVPKALSEVDMEDPVPWSERGDDYEEIRQELLDLLMK